jgi:flagellar hook assembly protein FlgD
VSGRAVLRKLLIVAVLAGLLATPAHAQLSRELLMPGVVYERQVQFTSHGPVAIHVITAPQPGGLWTVKPYLPRGVIAGRERVTTMQRTASRDATVAGINGDLFSLADSRPSGIHMDSGLLVHPPLADRSSIGFGADGALRVERVRFFGTWRGLGQRRPMGLNQPPGPNGISLFTPTWGAATPATAGALEAVIHPFPPATPNGDLVGPVVHVAASGGGTPIPADGAVLAARGTAAQRLAEEGPPGTQVAIRLLLSPDWDGVAHAIGGGPALVREGKPIFRHLELFSAAQLARNPRTAVGQLADGRMLLVVVDGRRGGYSVGMTNFELAQTMARLGAVSAAGLDAGGSATMAFEGSLLNRPSDPGGERSVANALFVLYEGVFVAPPSEAVLSPNGDGVGDVQALSYKLPRVSTATVDLAGPNGAVYRLDEGPKVAGVYRFSWDGTTPEGAPAGEGRWILRVTAVDDLERTSTAQRAFSLNRTLGGLTVAPALLRVRPNGPVLRTRFTLTRPARVAMRVETRAGAVVAIVSNRRMARGTHTIAWRGQAGRRLVHTGNYVVRVIAVNELGRSELTRPFAVRRVAG